MARRCDLTGKGVQSGNNVSHSNRKTRRTFRPNIQRVTLHSDALGRGLSMDVAVNTLRTVDHNGGLDRFLTTTSNRKLTPIGVALKKQIAKKIAEKAA